MLRDAATPFSPPRCPEYPTSENQRSRKRTETGRTRVLPFAFLKIPCGEAEIRNFCTTRCRFYGGFVLDAGRGCRLMCRTRWFRRRFQKPIVICFTFNTPIIKHPSSNPLHNPKSTHLPLQLPTNTRPFPSDRLLFQFLPDSRSFRIARKN